MPRRRKNQSNYNHIKWRYLFYVLGLFVVFSLVLVLPKVQDYYVSFLDDQQIAASVLISGSPVSPDSSGDSVGLYNSTAVDSSGFMVVAYYDSTNTNLKVLHCGNSTCSAGNSITTASTTDGQYVSMVLDANGFPVISFYDSVGGDLKLVHCNDVNCAGSDETESTVDSTDNVGQYSSLVLDGVNPLISYYDATNFDLKIADCNDANCAGSDETLTSVDTAGDVGQYSKIGLDSSGGGVVAYYDVTNTAFKSFDCTNAACSTGTAATVSNTGDEGKWVNLVAARNIVSGLVYAFYDADTADIHVFTCSNAACATPATSGTIGADDYSGEGISMVVDANDFPVITFNTRVNGKIMVVHCNDVGCTGDDEKYLVLDSVATSGDTSVVLLNDYTAAVSYYNATAATLKTATFGLSTTTFTTAPFDLDNPGNTGTQSSIVLDGGGNPVIVYDDDADVSVSHCGNIACSEKTTSVVTVVTTSQLSLGMSGLNPVFSYVDINSDMAVVSCSDPNCALDDETESVVEAGTFYAPSMQMNGSGFPVISYISSAGALMLAICNDAACDGVGEVITTVVASGVGTTLNSMVLNASGNAVIAYRDTANKLQIRTCTDANCTASGVNSPDSGIGGIIGNQTMVLSSGNPLIVYSKSGALQVTLCNDALCAGDDESSNSFTNLQAPSSAAVRLDDNGYPVIFYTETTRHHAYLIHCNDTSCDIPSEEDVMVIRDGVGSSDDHLHPALVLGSSDSFYLSSHNESNTALSFAQGTLNDPPTLSSFTAVQRTDGSGIVDVSIAVSDANSSPSTLGFYYDSDGNSDCNNFEGGFIDGQSGTLTASVGSTPSLNSLFGFQIGAGTLISTTSANTVTFDWHSTIDLPTTVATICLRATADDGSRGVSVTTTVALANTTNPGSAVPHLVYNDIVGGLEDVVVDGSGYPVMLLTDTFYGNVTLFRCITVDCTGGADSTTTLSQFDTHVSLALDDAGNPIIAGVKTTGANRDLVYMQCTNSTCTTFFTNTIQATIPSLWGIDVAWDSTNDLPVVSYYSNDNTLRLAKCNDAACAGANETLTTIATFVSTTSATSTSLVLNSNEYPVISYYDTQEKDMMLLYCNDVFCADGDDVPVNIDDVNDVGSISSVQLRTDGIPVIAYYDTTNTAIKLALCSEGNCSSHTTLKELDSDSNTFHRSGLVLSNNVARVANLGSVEVISCDSTDCLVPTVTAIETASTFASPMLYLSGSAVHAVYGDALNSGIRLASFANPATVSGGGGGSSGSQSGQAKQNSSPDGSVQSVNDSSPVVSENTDVNEPLSIVPPLPSAPTPDYYSSIDEVRFGTEIMDSPFDLQLSSVLLDRVSGESIIIGNMLPEDEVAYRFFYRELLGDNVQMDVQHCVGARLPGQEPSVLNCENVFFNGYDDGLAGSLITPGFSFLAPVFTSYEIVSYFSDDYGTVTTVFEPPIFNPEALVEFPSSSLSGSGKYVVEQSHQMVVSSAQHGMVARIGDRKVRLTLVKSPDYSRSVPSASFEESLYVYSDDILSLLGDDDKICIDHIDNGETCFEFTLPGVLNVSLRTATIELYDGRSISVGGYDGFVPEGESLDIGISGLEVTPRTSGSLLFFSHAPNTGSLADNNFQFELRRSSDAGFLPIATQPVVAPRVRNQFSFKRPVVKSLPVLRRYVPPVLYETVDTVLDIGSLEVSDEVVVRRGRYERGDYRASAAEARELEREQARAARSAARENEDRGRASSVSNSSASSASELRTDITGVIESPLVDLSEVNVPEVEEGELGLERFTDSLLNDLDDGALEDSQGSSLSRDSHVADEVIVPISEVELSPEVELFLEQDDSRELEVGESQSGVPPIQESQSERPSSSSVEGRSANPLRGIFDLFNR